jgi:ArsR family transcriptional regulator, lead/cadmium/zinc/bismuth-responsive transcriptional repressor
MSKNLNNFNCDCKNLCFCGNKCDCNPINLETIEEAKKNMIKEEPLEDLMGFFKIFGDITRIKILWALNTTEMCVSDISVLLNMSKSSISHQLKYLKKYNAVKSRKEGKIVYYSIESTQIKYIFKNGLQHTQNYK